MDLHLQDKVAVVTGAGKGIGLAVARLLVEEGALVAAGSRGGSAELDALAAGGRLVSLRVDLATADGPAELVAAAVERFGGLDILVNNVGGSTPRPGGFLSVGDEDWIDSFTFNTLSAIRASRAAIPHLLARGGGSIVNVSTVNSVLPVVPMPDYSAAKAALKSVSKVLSEEFGAKGIRVNTVSPGPTRTPLWLDPESGLAAQFARARGVEPQAVLDGMAANLALGRYCEPEEIAAAVVLLASDRAGSATGADWVVDAGRLKVM